VVSVLALFVGSGASANAQTVEVVRTFVSAPDGTHPAAGLLRATDGYLYGTTRAGGAHGAGSIFRIDAAGNLATLHSFNDMDGAGPFAALIQAPDGTLYGTTFGGGDWGFGTVFQWRNGELVTFHSFNDEDGAAPFGGLVYATDGQLYGTTSEGGAGRCGTIFQLNSAGDPVTVTTLHNFSSVDGCAPFATLTQGSDGLLYGTTQMGGAAQLGTLFAVDTSGALTTIHEFTGGDGAYPWAALVQTSDGRMFGTTTAGGATNDGTIFRLNTGAVMTIHSFKDSDGASPHGSLTVSSDGRLLGTTATGGVYGSGTVFEVRLHPSTGPDILSTRHHFNNEDGRYPIGGLVQAPDGTLFGTTMYGGTYGVGTVYHLSDVAPVMPLFHFGSVDGIEPRAGLIESWDGDFYGTTTAGGHAFGTIFKMDRAGTLTTLHSFDYATGANAQAPLIQASDGTLYGTTTGGGASGHGTIFRLDQGGVFAMVHSFDGTAGIAPTSGLVEGNDGYLYGTTSGGGASGMGTVFRIDVSGTLVTLHSFSSTDGLSPMAGLLKAADGQLYGTTWGGGTHGMGTIFRIDTSGTLTPIHSFDGNDGAYLSAALIQAADGLFYGTATAGGALWAGTMFRMDMTGAVTVLHHFDAAPNGLVQANDGNFYGSTNEGGAMNLGALFRIDAVGGYTQFHSFSGSDGKSPNGTLLQTNDGDLFGTTTEGGTTMDEPGTTNSGVVFRVTIPPGSSTTLESYPNPSTSGQMVTLTATVGETSGTVHFFNGTTLLASAPVVDGVARQTTSSLAVGSHQLRARYNGSSSAGPSVSPAVTQVVTEATFPLSVAVSGAGTGTVTSPDGLINCPGDCSETYSTGTAVVLTASPAAGSVFSGWSGACTGTGTCSVTMNTAASVAASFGISGADLVESTLSNPPATVAPGGRFTVSETVTNNGQATAAASTTQYYLSVDAAKDAGDLLIGARAIVSLVGGATSAGSKIVTVPAGTAHGVYYVLACADDRFKVVETNETNNCLASATTIVVGQPDLAVTALTDPPAEVAAGRAFGITDTVTNIGTVAAGGSTVRYYLSADGTKGAGDTPLTPTRAVVALGPGAASSGPATVTVPATTMAGVYRVLACADDLLRVAERDEANNCTASASSVEVKFPDLVETAISNPPATAAPGARLTVTDTVQNQGTIVSLASTTRYYFSIDSVHDAGDLLLTGNRAVPQLLPGATAGGTRTVTIPSTMPGGTYYLLACADATQKNVESDEANNCVASATTIIVGP
jgi:uncharacterized repeat protein (TIGR03803 family)